MYGADCGSVRGRGEPSGHRSSSCDANWRDSDDSKLCEGQHGKRRSAHYTSNHKTLLAEYAKLRA